MAKKENLLEEFINPLKHSIRTRKGFNLDFDIPIIKKKVKKEFKEFNLFGNTIHLDNEVPGIIQDVFDNRGYITKDKRKPQIIKKTRTGYGWKLVIDLPPGIDANRVKKDQNFFSNAIKGFVTIEWTGAVIIMDAQTIGLPNLIHYKWDASPYEKMQIPIPIGYTTKGLEVFDLREAPHLLISGNTGWGKTVMMQGIANSVVDTVMVCIADPKRVDFRFLERSVLSARKPLEIENLLKAIDQESERRLTLIEKSDLTVTKIEQLENPLPYIVVLVDEMAQITKNAMDIMWRIASLSRAPGIHLVAATQYPYADIIPSKLRNLFEARMCYRVASEASSRVVLGEEGPMAAWLPPIKGRAIWKFGHEFKEVQTMFISEKQMLKLSKEHQERGWDIDLGTKMLPR